jgi:hypothetical protein
VSAVLQQPEMTEQPPPPDRPAKNALLRGMNKIMGQLAKDGIGKDRENKQQNFKFRGIDDIYDAVAPLLAQNGILVWPEMLTRECSVRESRSGGALLNVVVTAKFTFEAMEDESKRTVGPFYGEAMDSGDKATSKAMSVAYREAMIKVFCIPVGGNADGDNQSYEVADGDGPNLTNEKRDLYLPEMVELIAREDQMGFRQLWNELRRREQTGMWFFFNTKQKAAARAMLQNNPDVMK